MASNMKRVRFALIAAGVMAAVSVLVAACSLPTRISEIVFEPSPPPQPVVHTPRRMPYVPPPPPPKIVPQEEKPRTNWAAKLAELPKDESGGTDWVQALSMKLIDPKARLEPMPGAPKNEMEAVAAEDEPQELDLTLELVPPDMPDFKATYPHLPHTQILGCSNCHTSIFQMQAGADPITMEKILAGEYCGRCHGKVAFDPGTGCPRCHLSMPK